MHRKHLFLMSSVLLPLILVAVPQAGHSEVSETRMLEERIAIDEPERIEVVVGNIFGSIRVSGHAQALVEMTARETIRARTSADLERARAEVALQTERDDGRIAFVAARLDGNCKCKCSCRWDDYIVEYDIVLAVPSGVSVDVSTVNNGEIVVAGVHGDFEISNVNGAITLEGLRGSGKARTVNGRLTAAFDRAPQADTTFSTVNGEIEVAFPDNLAADLRFKTMNGEVWTDFAATPLPSIPIRAGARTDDGRFTIRSDRAGVRVGSGGPTHTFDTLNGDIYVRRSP